MAWTGELVVHLAVAASVSAALAWGLRRARRPAAREGSTDVRVLRYPALWNWVGILDMALGLGLWGLTAWLAPDQLARDGHVIVPIALGISLLGAVLLAETWIAEIRVSPRGVASRSPWTGQRELAWHEIERVTFSPVLMWFVLRGRGGRRIYVSSLVQGIPDLAAAVRGALEPEAYRQAERFFNATPGL